ncbi:signal peptidase I [Gillisia sp. Hel1_33_143]|uniref:signal peptidase I n=1 Tax=Gillisia sp. Hel1_33_143 TaxID=1336796 RepID=UPI00087D1B67|nr:signal peptidase I [Gillisia sp. Hel1_33_143]SDS43738.1 signal peptidase I [Gillisia sp. Hel1_33_143]
MTFTQWFIFFLIVQVIHFLGTWKLYVKAGRKAWEAAIPVYNAVVLMKIINRPWWWTILLFVPIVNLIMFPVIWVETIRSFGKNSTLDTVLVIATLGFYIYYINYIEDVTYIEERSLQPKTSTGEWISSILFAVIAATIVHTYLIQPFTIPTSSLEKTLLVGDFLFVSKFHYGARTPMTAVAFPMVHDTLPFVNTKSYLSKPQIPYFRFPGFEDIERSDIVVFNWPVDTMRYMTTTDKYYYKPIDKKTNYVKRAVGVAGDSLQIKDGKVFINSKPLNLPGRARLQTSYIGKTKDQPLNPRVMYQLYGVTDPYRYDQNSNTFWINLTDGEFEKFKNDPNVASVQRVINPAGNKDRSVFPQSEDNNWNQDNFGPIFIPKAGTTTPLTIKTLPLYKRIIEVYEGSEMGITNKLSTNGTQVLLNGTPTNSYTFQQDYYWMMGDNRHNSLDSRYFGYVPFNHVVGKPVFIWMSWDTNASGLDKIRWNRLFTTVKGDSDPVSYLPYAAIIVAIGLGFSYFKKRRDA